MISALNASLFLFLTCILALMIEVSAKKEAHAQVEMSASRSRDVEPSSVPAPHATSADKPVPAKKYVARRARTAPSVEEPVRLGHRDYPVEVRERTAPLTAPEPSFVEPPPELPPDRGAEPEVPGGGPEEGVSPEGMPPEGAPAEG